MLKLLHMLLLLLLLLHMLKLLHMLLLLLLLLRLLLLLLLRRRNAFCLISTCTSFGTSLHLFYFHVGIVNVSTHSL
jgi:hypothetical protein